MRLFFAFLKYLLLREVQNKKQFSFSDLIIVIVNNLFALRETTRRVHIIKIQLKEKNLCLIIPTFIRIIYTLAGLTISMACAEASDTMKYTTNAADIEK